MADLESAARTIVRDWATNAFPYYSPAPSGTHPAVDGQRDMSAVLPLFRTRKEMRAGGKGIIKFQGGEIDDREVIVDDDYITVEASDDSEDEEEDDDQEDDEAEDEEGFEIGSDEGEELELEDGPEPSSGSDVEDDVDESEEDDEEEEEEPVPVVINSRKRKGEASPVSVKTKKAKRVSFGKNESKTIEARNVKGLKRKRG